MRFYTKSKSVRCSKPVSVSCGGFSLIGLSLFIVVLGLFTVGGILLAKQHGWSQKQDTGFTTVAQVEEAMKNYRAMNGNLPCPARMDLAPTDTNFGVSNCTIVGATTVARVAGARNIPGVPASQERVKIGSVPVRSLNLPDSAIVDGWGRRLVYAVTEYYTNGSPNFDADRGTIEIVDAQGRDMTPDAPQSVIYAVLMPGAEGRGARSMAGAQVENCPATGNTAENCDMNDAMFVSSVLKQFRPTSNTNLSYTANVKYASVEKAYHWEAADWKDCECTGSGTANPDKNPTQDRKTPSGYDTVGSNNGVRCVDQSGTQVADSKCLASAKPKASQSCAAFCWKAVMPSCSCGVTVKEKVTCERYFDNDDDIVGNPNCTAFTGMTYQAKSHSCSPCQTSNDDGGWHQITWHDNGDGTHTQTSTNYNSDGTVADIPSSVTNLPNTPQQQAAYGWSP